VRRRIRAGARAHRLNSDKPRPTIEVVDVPVAQLTALQGTESREAWTAVLKVSVGPDQPATIGTYQIDNGRIVFTPMFPLDPGRQYHVTFTTAGAAPLTSIVSLPARSTTPATMVAEVYPTAEVVPENQLRLYIHFNASMGSRGGLSYVHLFAGTAPRWRIRSCRSTRNSGTTIAPATPCSSIRAARSAASRRSPTWVDR
jgi:hypothetical protein